MKEITKDVYIYALTAPSGQIHYIGRTVNPSRRFNTHAGTEENTPKGLWIRGLRSIGEEPGFVVLDTTDEENAHDIEKWWIEFGLRMGWKLTNTMGVKTAKYNLDAIHQMPLSGNLVASYVPKEETEPLDDSDAIVNEIISMLSNKGKVADSVEKINNSMTLLIQLTYDVDETGLCNIDSLGHLRGIAPWSTRNYGRYGLLRTEANVLAVHIRRLSCENDALYTWVESQRKWHVNLDIYPTKDAALEYWDKRQLTVDDFLLLKS